MTYACRQKPHFFYFHCKWRTIVNLIIKKCPMLTPIILLCQFVELYTHIFNSKFQRNGITKNDILRTINFKHTILKEFVLWRKTTEWYEVTFSRIKWKLCHKHNHLFHGIGSRHGRTSNALYQGIRLTMALENNLWYWPKLDT